ncbi:MAG: sulfate ABC transporter permease subunit CysT [Actinomycetota bacterium]|nr:sulfate ABC transporter permease subunit CysT [Actinomycetota bacterium]
MSSEALPLGRTRTPSATGLRSGLGRWGLRAGALIYLGGMIALPLSAVISKGFANGLDSLRAAMTAPGAVAAIRLTLITALAAALVNAIFGTLLSYVLVRYRFPGRGVLSAVVDLPFAIPTLVTGVMLVALYGPASPVGGWLEAHGIHIVFAPLGVLLALLFVTLPFVVRTVQPVLAELDVAQEEAAEVLGASRLRTFVQIVLPALRPAIAAGTLLSFARALGEFGSIVIVSGNITNHTLTAPVFIFQLASQFRSDEAAAVSAVLFAMSFGLVLVTYRLAGNRGDRP